MGGKFCIVAGSFGFFHRGHEKLLDEAIRTGLKIIVGLTSDQYTSRTKRYQIPPYTEREEGIRQYLSSKGADFTIMELGNTMGDAPFNAEYGAVVASRETEKNVLDLNVKRLKNGINSMEIRLVDTQMADDLFPISSRRIASGEIDRDGRRLSVLKISLHVPGWVKVESAGPLLKHFFGETHLDITVEKIESFPQHSNTSRILINSLKDRDYAISIFMKHSYRMDTGRHYISSVCRILDRYGLMTEGASGEVEIWDSIYSSIMEGNSGIFNDESAFSELIPHMMLESMTNAVFPRKNPWQYGYTHYFSAQP